MITCEQLERKFLLKNKTVVYTPEEVPMKLKREKVFKLKVKNGNHESLLEDSDELAQYLRTVKLTKDDGSLYESKELGHYLSNKKSITFKSNEKEYMVSKDYYFIYYLDNKDYYFSFEGTEKLVDFLNKNKFSI